MTINRLQNQNKRFLTRLVTLTAALSTLLTGAVAHSTDVLIRGGYSQNMIITDNQNSQQGMDALLVVNHSVNESLNGIVILQTQKDLKNSEESLQIADTLALLQKRIYEDSNQNIKLGGGFVLPTSKDSKDRQQLNLGTRLEITDNFETSKLAAFKFSGYLKLTQLSHRYETAIDGSLNTATNLRKGFSVDYLIGKFSLNATFDHINSWKYTGKQNESFEASQEISLGLGKNMSASLGHTNSGSVLKENGTDSNIQFINENQSVVYVGLSLSL